MKKFEILPSPLGEGVRRTEGVISEDQRSGGQKGFWEGRKLGGQEGKPVNKHPLAPLGRGLGRGGDKKPSESTNSPSLKFVSSHPFANKFFSLPRRDSCATHTVKDLFASLEFAPRLQSFADVPLAQSAQSVRYPDFVRPQIRYSPIRLFTFKKAAFTLAEVMIVVAIIGVVAALVMPSFIQNMSERINSHRQANIAQKITKSVELMVANGDYQEISNTEEFVNKLSKYLKISKVCDSNHLTDCWPTRKIKTAKGEYYNVEDAKTAADLHVGKDNDTPNVGLVLADGASLIMTFNPKASPITFESGFTSSSKELPIGNKKTQNFAYTSNATDAIDFVMDVNGKTGPNQERDNLKNEYYDIRSFKAAVFDGCPGIMIPDIGCIVQLSNNSWNNAIKNCKALGENFELPNNTTLTSIYNKRSQYPSVPQSGNFWSSNEHTNGVDACAGYSGFYCAHGKGSSHGVLCVGKYL